MAAKRGKGNKSPRRRNTASLNVVNLAQTYLQTAIITQSAFRTTPYEFFTGQQAQTLGKSTYVNGNWVTSYTTTQEYMPIQNGTALTLPELFGRDKADGTQISAGGAPGQFWESVKTNVELSGGWFKPIAQTAVLNVGFTLGKRVFKDQLGIIRKGLKMAKLDRMVKV